MKLANGYIYGKTIRWIYMAYKVLAKRLGFKWDQCDPSNLSWELA
jgi:hypothetical protein